MILSDEERLALEAGYKKGSDHRFCVRCCAILLKSGKLSDAEVLWKLDVAEPSVFNWTKRYAADWISRSEIKTGTTSHTDNGSYRRSTGSGAVLQERQSVKAANNLWEASSGMK